MIQGMPAHRDAAGQSTVASTAMAMPIMPYRLPRRAVSWLEQTAEAQDEEDGCADVGDRLQVLVRHVRASPYFRNIASMRWVTAKAAEHVDGGEHNASAGQATGSSRRGGCTVAAIGASDLHQRADDDDAADGVGHAHQRRVQRRLDVPDHHVAHEARQHKHREVRQERCWRVGTDKPEQARADTPNMMAALVGRRGLARRAMAVAFCLAARRRPPVWPQGAGAGGFERAAQAR